MPQRKMLLLLSLKLLFTRSECYVVFYLNNIIVHGSLIFIPVESSGFLREPNCSARQGSSGNQAYTESKSCARRNRKCWSPQTDSEKGEIPETYSQRMAYDFFCPFFFFFLLKCCASILLQNAKAETTKVVDRKTNTRAEKAQVVQQPKIVVFAPVQVRLLG